MAASLPYLVAPGSINTALEKIKTAATPERVSGDFVNTKLQIKGGTGSAIPPFLKKMGFVAADGSPTELYKKFRNNSTSGTAVAEAIKIAYKELLEANEYFYDLSDPELADLIIQVTGAEKGNKIVQLTLSTYKNIRKHAQFDATETEQISEVTGSLALPQTQYRPQEKNSLGLNLSYTINLNLPATSDQAVFNAIFKSLKEHLINEQE